MPAPGRDRLDITGARRGLSGAEAVLLGRRVWGRVCFRDPEGGSTETPGRMGSDLGFLRVAGCQWVDSRSTGSHSSASASVPSGDRGVRRISGPGRVR